MGRFSFWEVGIKKRIYALPPRTKTAKTKKRRYNHFIRLSKASYGGVVNYFILIYNYSHTIETVRGCIACMGAIKMANGNYNLTPQEFN